jgi:hypothetical protein
MRTTLFIAAAIAGLSSCYTPRFAYSPTAHNVPVLAEKNDSKLAVNYSTNADSRSTNNQYTRNRSNGIDVQGAYAITNHVGVQASYFTRTERTVSNQDNDNYFDSSVIRYNRNLFEFGAGYFTPIDDKGKVFFQVFGGLGFGKFKFTDNGKDQSQSIYSRHHDANIMKYYIEPSITFKPKPVIAASLSARFSIVNFKNINTDYTIDEKKELKLDSLNRYASVFFEPSFVNSYGFNKLPGLRIEYQLGLSMLASRQIMDYRRFNFSIGLMFDIPKLIKGMGSKERE